MYTIKEEEIRILSSYCKKCSGMVRVRVIHKMTEQQLDDFNDEVEELDLNEGVQTIYQYRDNLKWCYC